MAASDWAALVIGAAGMVAGLVAVLPTGLREPLGFEGACSLLCEESESAAVQLDLGRKYQTLKATFGISDNSNDPSSSANIEVIADGSVIYDKSFELGQSQNVDLNVSGVLRLTFQFSGPLGNVYPAIGEPTVYQ